jgi:hypothetical protein
MPAVVDHYVKLFRVIGSPGYPLDEAQMRERILAGLQRSYHPVGTVRQLVAVAADTGRRAAELGRINAPTWCCTARTTPWCLIPAVWTRRRIPGARLVGIGGMGHDLAPGVVDRLLEPLMPHLHAV